MNLYEYQAKAIFAQHAIPTLQGILAATPAEANQAAEKLTGPVVVKAQVLVGGRGKAGGVRTAADADAAEEAAAAILHMSIKGQPVRQVLVERAAAIAQELYVSLTLDRGRRQFVMMGCAEGGVEIEEVAVQNPEKIISAIVDPLLGLQLYQTREIASGMELERSLQPAFSEICMALYRAGVANDALLAEINPLVVTTGGSLLALDGKMVIDDNALFRQTALAEAREHSAEETPAEREARHFGLSYVKLEGQVGCLVNGAGLAMATMDVIKSHGGEPANFLDIGGGARAEKVAAALRIILSDPNVRSVLINIFGGITRCDEVAEGILDALSQVPANLPLVVRLVGTREEEGRAILANTPLQMATSLSEAAEMAVHAARGA